MSENNKSEIMGDGEQHLKLKRPYSSPKIVLRENVEVIAADCTSNGKATPVDCLGTLQS